MNTNAPLTHARQAFMPIQLGADSPEALARTLDEFLLGMATQGAARGRERLRDAEAAAAFANQAATNQAVIVGLNIAPVAAVASALPPPRRWIYGRTAITGFISLLVAPGGMGKSALAMVEAVAMASGLELLAGEKPVRPLRVWMHNAEDDKDEMQRRLSATLKNFHLTTSDLNGNLFMTSDRRRDCPQCQGELQHASQPRRGLAGGRFDRKCSLAPAQALS